MLRSASRTPKHVEALISRPLHRHNIRSSGPSSVRDSRSRPRLLTAKASVPSSSRCLPTFSRLRPPLAVESLQSRLCPHPFHYSTASYTTSNEEAEVPETGSNSHASRWSAEVVDAERVQERFQRLGLNANISRQLTLTHPNIRQPTPAQSALIPAILSPTDVILRAHTGTGKSFGILLALLSKPRIVFKDQTPQDVATSSILKNKRNKAQTGIASIILVPSNELALQYMRWARSLLPASSLPSLDPVMQCLVRGGLPGPDALSPDQELLRLKETPPHILIGTPGRIKDILDTPAGSSLLGLDTLKTLVLDEADNILQLPGRFPSYKQRWNNEIHKAPGLLILNDIMKRRATYSGGEKHLSAGLENRPGKKRDERRPPENVRRNAYKAAERAGASNTDANTGLALPKPRRAGVQPLQLIATSATANSVMRHFFGARTGWLRTGAKDSGLTFAPQVGRWIDFTGLSGKSMIDQGIRGLFGPDERTRTESLINTSLDQTASTMPKSIAHTCVVVDEAPLSKQLAAIPLRNFEPKLARKKGDATASKLADSNEPTESMGSNTIGEDFMIVKPDNEPQEHEMDQTLIEALAFCFASDGVDRGLALIPARWSLLKTRAALEALGVTVRLASELTSEGSGTRAEMDGTGAASAGPELFLLQTTSARGLDIPALSHVFLVGYPSVLDAVQYVHSAGRVARIGGDPDAPISGKVVTLLRGLPHDTPMPAGTRSDGDKRNSDQPKKAISTSEAKMANVFRRLGVVPKKLDLRLLTSDTTAAAPLTDKEHPDTITLNSEATPSA